jgi:hypothetical protein
MDFLLWGYIKNVVYDEKIRDLWHLQDRIAAVPPDIIERNWHEIEYCLNIYPAINGAHIRIHQGKTKTSDIS